jgi:hypothetical protein
MAFTKYAKTLTAVFLSLNFGLSLQSGSKLKAQGCDASSIQELANQAAKDFQKVRAKNQGKDYDRLVVTFEAGSKQVKAYPNAYHAPSELVAKTVCNTVLPAQKVVVTQREDLKTVCVTTYDANNNRVIDSKTVSCGA